MKTLEYFCPDFTEWPESWHGVKEDIPYGQGLIDAMRPFAEHLTSQVLAKKTIKTHLDNLWLLGGEIIRSANTFDQYNIPPVENLFQNVDQEGGPYCRHLDSESQQRSYDATCRKLYKFLMATRKMR